MRIFTYDSNVPYIQKINRNQICKRRVCKNGSLFSDMGSSLFWIGFIMGAKKYSNTNISRENKYYFRNKKK
jgi:hypothetical protein